MQLEGDTDTSTVKPPCWFHPICGLSNESDCTTEHILIFLPGKTDSHLYGPDIQLNF